MFVFHNLHIGASQTVGEHTVVLIQCHQDFLVFMNSWDQKFADGGYDYLSYKMNRFFMVRSFSV